MVRFLLVCVLCFASIAQSASAQELARSGAAATETAVDEAGVKFHRALIKAAVKANKDGKLKRAELFKLRVAMLSPAFRQHAEELAILQMSASGSDNVPMTPEGAVDRASIDWDALLAFLEKLIPIILQLIEMFGTIDNTRIFVNADGIPLYAVVSVGGQLFAIGA